MRRDPSRRRRWKLGVLLALATTIGGCVAEPAPPSPYYDWYTTPYYPLYYPDYYYWPGGWGHYRGWYGGGWHGEPHGGAHGAPHH